jgi:hypothetical protein
MPPTRIDSAAAALDQRRSGFAAVAGLFLGLSLLKFGNPAVLDSMVATPAGYWEFMLQPWPLVWGYTLLLGLVVMGVWAAERRFPRAGWPTLLPLAWLFWQALAAPGSIDARLTRVTLPYLAATVAGFYLGLVVLAPARRTTVFWTALTGCFAAVLLLGFQQRFGGLEAVRQHIQSQPGWERLPADYLARLANNRIFATLVYPNALAGAILLLLPAVAVAAWQQGEGRPRPVRLVLPAALVLAGLACLYWSKSKAGWLLALALALVIGLHLPASRRLKRVAVTLALLVGLGGFAWRFAGYFQGGATSVGARIEYWRAGWKTAVAHPVLGTGPGTFATSYRAIKPPHAEMAMLTHNDYLQQASDSGFPGAILYLGFLGVSLWRLHRRAVGDPLRFAVWAGLLGWAAQGLVEFALYVPAVAWTAFWLLGWLWGQPTPPLPRQPPAEDPG